MKPLQFLTKLLAGMQNGIVDLKNSLAVSYKVNYVANPWYRNSPLDIYSREKKSVYEKVYIRMFIAAPNWKQH